MRQRFDVNDLRERLGSLDPRVLIAEIVLLAVIIGALVFGLYLRFPDLPAAFRSVEAFQSFMEDHREKSVPLYIIIQAVQVIVSVIPGQIVQIAGGYFYGFWYASLWSVTGIAIGSTAAFFLARSIGQKPIKRVYGSEMVDRYTGVLSSKNAFALMLFLYIVPGFPKDVLAFFAGLSDMKYSRFLPLATVARYPAMAISMLIGSRLGVHSYKAVAAIVMSCLLFILICYVFREKLLSFSDIYFKSDRK